MAENAIRTENNVPVLIGYDRSHNETIRGTFNDAGCIVSVDDALEIARGVLPGRSALNKFGLNDTVGTTTETIWDAGGLYSWLSTASILDIQSNNTNDTSAGTGARTILIQGLDANYADISETITLNGTTIVNTTNSYLRIFRIIVLTAGSGGGAEGIITAKVGATTYAQIDNGNNQTLMAVYTIPAGKTGYLIYGKASTGVGKDATVYFKARPLGGVFNVKHVAYIVEGSYDYRFTPPLQIPEKTDVCVDAAAGQASTSISAVFDIILIDN